MKATSHGNASCEERGDNRRALAMLLLPLFGLWSCSETTPSATESVETAATVKRPLTIAEARTLSQILVKNFRIGGSHFRAAIDYGPAAEITLEGDIDWTKWSAVAVLSTKRSDGVDEPDRALFWKEGVLTDYTNSPSQSKKLDPKSSPLDRVAVLINSMSNARPENPILIRQRPDVFFGGDVGIDGETHQALIFGSVTYFVNEKGELRRLSANFDGFAGPVVVDFTDRGPHPIDEAKLPRS